MAKPDNRADNVEHLQQSIQNTQQNLHEAEGYLNEFSSEISNEERKQIEEKIIVVKKVLDHFAKK